MEGWREQTWSVMYSDEQMGDARPRRGLMRTRTRPECDCKRPRGWSKYTCLSPHLTYHTQIYPVLSPTLPPSGLKKESILVCQYIPLLARRCPDLCLCPQKHFCLRRRCIQLGWDRGDLRRRSITRSALLCCNVVGNTERFLALMSASRPLRTAQYYPRDLTSMTICTISSHSAPSTRGRWDDCLCVGHETCIPINRPRPVLQRGLHAQFVLSSSIPQTTIEQGSNSIVQ